MAKTRLSLEMKAIMFCCISTLMLSNGLLVAAPEPVSKSKEFFKKLNQISNPKFQDRNQGSIGLNVYRRVDDKFRDCMTILPQDSTFCVVIVCSGIVRDGYEKSTIVEKVPRWDDIPHVKPVLYVSNGSLNKMINLLKSKGINFKKSMNLLRDDAGSVVYLEKIIMLDVKLADIQLMQKIFDLSFPEKEWKSVLIKYNGINDREIVELVE